MNFNEVKKVKTAVVGCGMISNIYIRNLLQLFSVIDLVAVADINRAAAEEKAKTYGVPKVMTVDEVAADEEIELVVNLTAPFAHYTVIKQMLEAGKNVYTEKMFTTELEDARELCRLADERRLYLGVAPDTVLGAGIQTARRIIDSGLIGEVTSGFVSVTRNQNLNSEIYRFLQRDGGSILYDVGVYYVGALISLFGTVKSVRGYGAPALMHEKEILFADNKDSWQIPGNNVIAAGLQFKNGALVSVHLNGNAAGSETRALCIYGTKGTLELGDPNSFNGYVKLILPEGKPVEIPFTHGYDGRNMVSEPSPFDGYGNRGIGVAEMAWAMRQNRPSRLSKEFGLHCEEVLVGITEAVTSGQTYELKSECEVKPLAQGYYSSIFDGTARGDAEKSLIN